MNRKYYKIVWLLFSQWTIRQWRALKLISSRNHILCYWAKNKIYLMFLSPIFLVPYSLSIFIGSSSLLLLCNLYSIHIWVRCLVICNFSLFLFWLILAWVSKGYYPFHFGALQMKLCVWNTKSDKSRIFFHWLTYIVGAFVANSLQSFAEAICSRLVFSFSSECMMAQFRKEHKSVRRKSIAQMFCTCTNYCNIFFHIQNFS